MMASIRLPGGHSIRSSSPIAVPAGDWPRPSGVVRCVASPRPWRTEKIPGGYVVRDTNGQAIAYVYGGQNLDAVGRCPQSGARLASQSTISRLENAPSKTEAARLCAALARTRPTMVALSVRFMV
jgi:hypothetical protein